MGWICATRPCGLGSGKASVWGTIAGGWLDNRIFIYLFQPGRGFCGRGLYVLRALPAGGPLYFLFAHASRPLSQESSGAEGAGIDSMDFTDFEIDDSTKSTLHAVAGIESHRLPREGVGLA